MVKLCVKTQTIQVLLNTRERCVLNAGLIDVYEGGSMQKKYLWCVLLLAACGKDNAATGALMPSYSYHTDLKPLLDAKCGICHTEGNIAPFALNTYADFVAHKAAVLDSLKTGSMPPMPPSEECNTYRDGRTLGAQDRARIVAWLEGTMEEGQPAAGVLQPQEQPFLDTTEYNLHLQYKEGYTPVPSHGTDDHRCFVYDVEQDGYVTGSRVVPDVRNIVHHVVVWAVKPEDTAFYHGWDAETEEAGFPCPSGPSKGQRIAMPLGGWVPGAMPRSSGDKIGTRIKAGSAVIVDMHYSMMNAPAQLDKTSVDIRIVPTVEKPGFGMLFTNPRWVQAPRTMKIPAGQADVMHDYSLDLTQWVEFLVGDWAPLKNNEPFVIHNVGLHMHTKGIYGTLEVVRKNNAGKACLVHIPKWDFNWQGSYDLATPVTVYPGDEIRIECHWNNAHGGAASSSHNHSSSSSAHDEEPKDVFWGEDTSDEMCVGILYVTGL
jgi:hypothetical protein